MDELLLEIGRRVAGLAAPAYFVGGCVRDFLRGEALKDVDFVLTGDPHAVGRSLARAYGGHVFWLRQEEDVVRVFLPEHGRLQVDLTVLRGGIEEDLLARDLTVNAMAVPAEAGLGPNVPLLDPSGGQADLAAGVVRFVSPSAPERDPLRTLRALRFRWKLGFRLAEETAVRLAECAPLLARVSSERVRDELFQLLAMAAAAEALAECYRFGMAPRLTGFDRVSASDERLAASVARVETLCRLVALPSLPNELRQLLEREPTPPRRRREVLLWAGALEPLLTPEEAGEAARHLALSNDERQLIVKALNAAPKVRETVGRWPVAGRERYHLFRQAGVGGPEAVLLAAADEEWGPPHSALLGEALDRLLRPRPPLLTGNQVMEIAGLKPGPEVGRLMERVAELRADGSLQTPEEAEMWLREQAGG